MDPPARRRGQQRIQPLTTTTSTSTTTATSVSSTALTSSSSSTRCLRSPLLLFVLFVGIAFLFIVGITITIIPDNNNTSGSSLGHGGVGVGVGVGVGGRRGREDGEKGYAPIDLAKAHDVLFKQRPLLAKTANTSTATKNNKLFNDDKCVLTNDMHNLPSNLPEEMLSSSKLCRAVQLSLSYLVRSGHDRRVEYLIGFNSKKHFDDPASLQQLSVIRDARDNSKQRMYNRDYHSKPIGIRGYVPQPSSEIECDIACTKQCDPSGCDFQEFRFSMENVEVRPQHGSIVGSTQLSSQVPVPYFSYHDFAIMRPVKPKTQTALAAAFISNCASHKRNQMVEDLQRFGVKVDSYGRCMHNKDEKKEKSRDHSKLELLSSYKFSLAFENSETDDYITEKFFLTLSSGSVPVYLGAPNVKFFAPDTGPYPYDQVKSVIYTGDFDFDSKKLANYLLYLDKNDTAYAQYLQWKIDGYSGDFKALIELTSTHTGCRQCVFGGDQLRMTHGLAETDAPLNVYSFGNGKIVFVRERGSYRFIQIQMKENIEPNQQLQHLIECIMLVTKRRVYKRWKDNEHPNYDRIGPAVYAIYHIPTKHVVHTNEAVLNIPDSVELEFILV